MPEYATQLGGESFNGILDDLRIYEGALNANSVLKLYNRESTGSLKGDIGTIPAGSSVSKSYLFANDDDLFDEGDESVTFTIDSVVYGETSSNLNSVSVSIIENDIRPEVALSLISGDTLREGTNNSTKIKATLSETTTRDVSISIGSSGTASASDFDISLQDLDELEDENSPKLSLHLKLDGNANDETSNNYNGQISGAALIEDRFGNDISALYFDGTNDFVKIPLSGANSNLFEDDITVSLWVKDTVMEQERLE